MVVFPLTVTSPTVAVAKVAKLVPVLETPKITLVLPTQTELYGPAAAVPQTEPVQVAFVPFVFQ